MSTFAMLFASSLFQAAGGALGYTAARRLADPQRHRFLRHWTRAWLWRCATCVLAATDALVSLGGGAVAQVGRVVLALGVCLGTFFQVAYFAFAGFELAADGSMTAPRRRKALIAATAAGVVVAVLGVLASDPLTRVLLRNFVPTAPLALALAGVSVAVKYTPQRDEDIGRRLLVAGLVLFAVNQLGLAWTDAGGAAPLAVLSVGITDFVLALLVAFALTILVLEEQHHGARIAAADVDRLTNYDDLTGLPNRQFLLDRLQQAIVLARRAEQRLALYLIDVDRFKVINESLGHAAGDRVLHAVGQRLRQALRESDTVARIPGDEFAVVAVAIRQPEDAIALARKIQESVRQPTSVDGRELYVTASVGVSVFPEDGETSDSLLRHADIALHRAKQEGPDLFQLYTTRMNALAVEQLALEHALRRALSAGELELYYQPIVDTARNDVQIVEATLRWHHRELGLLRPDHFLGVAEATGVIVAIGEWALAEGCRQLSAWRATYPALRLAINISARQLRQPELVQKVSALLAAHSLPGSALELEISESAAGRSDDATVDRLRALRALGARIAIDDFGTGYTSLAVLRDFPVDTLKIDTSFVRDLLTSPRAGEIATAVVGLAHALQLTVVAEGVENPAQLELLRRRGCELWQGYLCCPPVTANDVATVLGRKLGSGKLVDDEAG